MSLDKALHLKIERETAEALQRLSAELSLSIGELVRRAIRRTYLHGIEGLSQRKAGALTAWEAGYISLGKLAEELGMDVLTLRDWLTRNGFDIHEEFSLSDADCV